MSAPNGSERPVPAPPPPMGGTPNAEKYVLEADAMRRRQLRSALVHGSRRTWREQNRVWPAIVVGIIAVAVVVAAMAVISAYQKQKEKKREQEEESALVWSQYAPDTPTRYVVRRTGRQALRLDLIARPDDSEGRH
ncbi:MAG: ABC transporter permease [Actinomycetia bacterium]|nr:ABC transporter permease [Actinomycetes bacterium]